MGTHVFRHVTRAVPLAHDKLSLEMECGHIKVVHAQVVGVYPSIDRAECPICTERAATRRKWSNVEWWGLWVFVLGTFLYGVLGVLNSFLLGGADIYIRLHYLALASFTCALAKVYGPKRHP